MEEFKNIVSVGTTFNKRIFDHKSAVLYDNMKNNYSDIPFYVYHENKFELEKYNQQIIFTDKWENCHLYDLFIENSDWLQKFLNTSRFKECRKIKDYWKRNSIFWFRKIVAMHNCIINHVDTKFLIWMGADTEFKKPLDNLFFDYCSQYDICHIDRSKHNMFTDTDFIVINLETNAKLFINTLMDIYKNGDIFKQDRWDDCQAFELTKKKTLNEIKYAPLTLFYKAPFEIYSYIKHNRGNLQAVRDKKFA